LFPTPGALEGSLTVQHAGPAILVIDYDSVKTLHLENNMAPAWFKSTFEVK
jgi:hypothetical protein